MSNLSSPVAYANPAEPTNNDVYVYVTFDENAFVNQYSFDGRAWEKYVPGMNGVSFNENGVVYFRSLDADGSVSPTTTYEVTNIDKVAPDAPVITVEYADTFGGVLVSAEFSKDSVTQEYSFEGKRWIPYQGEISVSESGTVVLFRATDAAGNESVTTYEFTNTPGGDDGLDAPVVRASTTEPTNSDVYVTAIFDSDAAVNQFSTDGQNWEEYADGINGIPFAENGTIYFRSFDAAGSISPVTTYEVTNIDKIAPDAPAPFARTNEVTNQDVFVFATFSQDSAKQEVSLDGENWSDYSPNGIPVSENGKVYFRATDEAGNVSEVAEYEVTNIDKVAPTAPVASSSAAETFAGVLVSAVFSDDSVTKEYSLDGRTWQVYQNAVPVDTVGTVVYFRATDAAGNVSDVTEYKVERFVLGPEAPVAQADFTAPTNGNVTVTAVFDETAAVNQYSFNTLDWFAYEGGIVFEENNVVYFRSLDTEGRSSSITTLSVENIDKVAPTAPVITVSATVLLDQQAVAVAAVFSDDSVTQEYSLDGQTWNQYSAPVLFTKLGTAYFRGTDAAGNVSEVSQYVVDNIDRPFEQDGYADDGWNDWWIDKVTGKLNNELNEVFFASSYEIADEILFDKKDSIAVEGWHNFVGKDEAGNIDAIDYIRLNVDENMRLCFTVTASDRASYYLVALTQNEDKYGRTVLSIRNLISSTLAKDKETKLYTGTFDEQLQEEMYDDTKYFLAVAPSNKKKEVFYNVEYDRSKSEFYRFCNNDDDGGPEQSDYNVVDIGKDLHVEGWVGFGDKVDFYGFSLEHSAKLNFGVTAGTYLAFDLYEYTTKNGNQTLNKKGKTLSLKSELVEMPESGSTGAITLDPGDYYFSVKCTNVQKCGEEEINYIIQLMPDSVFYMDSDDGWNNWVTRLVSRTKSELNAEVTDGEETFLDGLAEGIQFDIEGDVAKDYTYFDSSTGTNESDTYTNYVGIGDPIDFKKVSLGVAANLSFSVHASEASVFALYKLERNRLGVYSLKALQSTSVKYDRTAGEYQAKTKRIVLDKGDYYISMQAGKNAETSYYNVNVYSNDDDWDNSTVFFSESEGGKADDWTDVKTKGANSDLIGDVVELTQDFPWIGSGWVGYGDPIDYAGFTIDGPAKLVFDVTASDKAKFTVYTLQKKKLGYILKPVMEATLKENKLAETSDEKYKAETKGLLLTAPGTYYVSMQSTNASKGGNAYYNIDADKSTFFDNVKMNDSGNDKWKALNATAEKQHVITQKGTVLEGWVGYGDAVDYYGFSLKNNTNVVFSVTATDEAKFTLSAYTVRRGKASLKVVQKKTALKYNDKTGLYEFTMSKKMLSRDTLYYITMESTNATKGGSADYTVAVETFQPSFADALSMPETSDALANSDGLSLGQFAETSSAVSSAVTDALDDKLGSVMNAGWTTLA